MKLALLLLPASLLASAATAQERFEEGVAMLQAAWATDRPPSPVTER